MEPPEVPQENLRKAQLMRAELLFKTNKQTMVQEIKDTHNMNLAMTLLLTRSQGFKIKLCLTHCETMDTLNNVRCVSPTQDFLHNVRQILQEEVALLHQQIDVVTSGVAFACWYCGGGNEHTK